MNDRHFSTFKCFRRYAGQNWLENQEKCQPSFIFNANTPVFQAFSSLFALKTKESYRATSKGTEMSQKTQKFHPT